MRRTTGALTTAAVAGAITTAGVIAAVAWAARDVPVALGARPSGPRLDRMRRSPRYRDGAFRNAIPATTVPPGSGRKTLADLLRTGAGAPRPP
jgi:hypothetical protein